MLCCARWCSRRAPSRGIDSFNCTKIRPCAGSAAAPRACAGSFASWWATAKPRRSRRRADLEDGQVLLRTASRSGLRRTRAERVARRPALRPPRRRGPLEDTTHRHKGSKKRFGAAAGATSTSKANNCHGHWNDADTRVNKDKSHEKGQKSAKLDGNTETAAARRGRKATSGEAVDSLLAGRDARRCGRSRIAGHLISTEIPALVSVGSKPRSSAEHHRPQSSARHGTNAMSQFSRRSPRERSCRPRLGIERAGTLQGRSSTVNKLLAPVVAIVAVHHEHPIARPTGRERRDRRSMPAALGRSARRRPKEKAPSCASRGTPCTRRTTRPGAPPEVSHGARRR